MKTEPADAVRPRKGPQVIVIGNWKGGTGKSTVAVHLAIALLYRGRAVGVLDLDEDQGTLTRYLQNRRSWRRLDPLSATGAVRQFPMPLQTALDRPGAHPLRSAESAVRHQIEGALSRLADCDCVVIDTAGSPSTIGSLAHRRADILITPINDSLVDIDVLAEIDMASRTIVAPSRYSRMVMDIRERRRSEGMPLDWVVIRNRLPHVYSHNRRDIDRVLMILAQRLGFRQAPGFCERVVYREHFPTGLTALDMTVAPAAPGERALPQLQTAARREVETLADTICRAADRVPVPMLDAAIP